MSGSQEPDKGPPPQKGKPEKNGEPFAGPKTSIRGTKTRTAAFFLGLGAWIGVHRDGPHPRATCRDRCELRERGDRSFRLPEAKRGVCQKGGVLPSDGKARGQEKRLCASGRASQDRRGRTQAAAG